MLARRLVRPYAGGISRIAVVVALMAVSACDDPDSRPVGPAFRIVDAGPCDPVTMQGSGDDSTTCSIDVEFTVGKAYLAVGEPRGVPKGLFSLVDSNLPLVGGRAFLESHKEDKRHLKLTYKFHPVQAGKYMAQIDIDLPEVAGENKQVANLHATAICGKTECGTLEGPRCIDTSSNARHCGDCGTVCKETEVCDGGRCVCPQTREEFCQAHEYVCGDLTALDACSQMRHEFCGDCPGGTSCSKGQCVCSRETREEFCDRHGAECGELTGLDRCGASWTTYCGECTDGFCGETTPNRCGCQAETDVELCGLRGLACGLLEIKDSCGEMRSLSCGGCLSNELCRKGHCCRPGKDLALCADSGWTCGNHIVIDGCGESRTIDCGGCIDDGVCVDGACTCVPEKDSAFCKRHGIGCGSFTATDNCGNTRAVGCGGCPEPYSCGEVMSHQCGCEAESEEELCAEQATTCGPLAVMDRCGTSRDIDCGSCGLGTCVAGACCVAETDEAFCSRHGAECGSFTALDDCGTPRTVNCGGCQGPATCGAVQDNRCGCDPETEQELCTAAGAACGDLSVVDRCGQPRNVTCGDCPSGTCLDNQCCLGESDATLCQNADRECGSFSTTDQCGKSRSIDCGGCASGTCLEGQCCVGESDAQLCQNADRECGSFSTTDRCGKSRSIHCGSCSWPETCSAGSCSCQPESNESFCARLATGSMCRASGYDNCNQYRSNVDCSSRCSYPDTCGGGGVPGVCGCAARSDQQLCQDHGRLCGDLTVTECGIQRQLNCGSCCPFSVTIVGPTATSLTFWDGGVGGALQTISYPLGTYPAPAGACSATVDYIGRQQSIDNGTFPQDAPAGYADLQHPNVSGRRSLCVLPVGINWGITNDGGCCSSPGACGGRICVPGAYFCNETDGIGSRRQCNGTGNGYLPPSQCSVDGQPVGCLDQVSCQSCPPGRKRCFNGKLYTCLSDGSGEYPTNCPSNVCANAITCL